MRNEVPRCIAFNSQFHIGPSKYTYKYSRVLINKVGMTRSRCLERSRDRSNGLLQIHALHRLL